MGNIGFKTSPTRLLRDELDKRERDGCYDVTIPTNLHLDRQLNTPYTAHVYSNHKETVLMKACRLRLKEITLYLLDIGCDPDIEGYEFTINVCDIAIGRGIWYMWTAGQPDITKVLLKRKCLPRRDASLIHMLTLDEFKECAFEYISNLDSNCIFQIPGVIIPFSTQTYFCLDKYTEDTLPTAFYNICVNAKESNELGSGVEDNIILLMFKIGFHRLDFSGSILHINRFSGNISALIDFGYKSLHDCFVKKRWQKMLLVVEREYKKIAVSVENYVQVKVIAETVVSYLY